MKINTILSSIVLGLLVLFPMACNTVSYPYSKGLEMYMSQEHATDLTQIDDRVYYFIPLNDCSSCKSAELNLSFLNNLVAPPANLSVVLIGSTRLPEYKESLQKLRHRYTVLEDTNGTMFNYQTGLGKPLLIHIKKGEVTYYLSITDFDLETVEAYLTN